MQEQDRGCNMRRIVSQSARTCGLGLVILFGLALEARPLSSDFNFSQYATVGGWCTAVTVAGNYAYAAEGCSFMVLDVSNPAAPRLLRKLNMGDRINQVSVEGTTAYASISNS